MLAASSVWHLVFGMPQILFIVGGVVAIAAIAFLHRYKSQKVQSDNEVKRTMVQRGMNAEHIERIMPARTEDDFRSHKG